MTARPLSAWCATTLHFLSLVSFGAGAQPSPSSPAPSTQSQAQASIQTQSSASTQTGAVSCSPTQCCGTATITAISELNSLEDCASFHGELYLSGLTVPTDYPTPVTFSIPVPTITGNLVITDIHQTGGSGYSVSFDPSAVVSQDVIFSNLDGLQMPQFGGLNANSIAFQNVQFADSSVVAEPLNLAPSFGVTPDLTFNGTNLQSIAFSAATMNYLTVANNAELQTINITGLSTLTPNVRVSNNPSCTVVDLADMATAGVLDIQQNSHLSSLILTDLATIQDAAMISGNNDLSVINMPALLHVQSNLTIEGDINTLNVPMLKTVAGAIDVISTGSLNCTPIKQLHAQSSPRCQSSASSISSTTTAATPSSGATSPGATSTASRHTHHTGLSSGASIGIGVGVGVGGALIGGAILFFCWRSRRRHSRRTESMAATGYSKHYKGYNADDHTYSEVPYEPATGSKQAQGPPSEEHTPSSVAATGGRWDPPESSDVGMRDGAEREAEPGVRHEMDARSIDFNDDDDDAETRSLEEIERVHGQR